MFRRPNGSIQDGVIVKNKVEVTVSSFLIGIKATPMMINECCNVPLEVSIALYE